MREYFKGSWPLFLVTSVLWIFSALSFAFSGSTGPQAVESRIDLIASALDEAAEKKVSPEERRHLIMSIFIREQYGTLREGLCLHLAIALFVAGLLIIAVDSIVRTITKKEFQKQTDMVSEAIWQAMLRRFVPEKVAKSLEAILRANVCRIRPQYTITFLRNPYQGVPDGKIVVRRELRYGLRNLTSERIPSFALRIQVETLEEAITVTDESGKAVHLPGIRTVKVGDKDISFEPGKSLETAVCLHATPGDTDVRTSAEELFDLNDRALYIITMPCLGLELSVVNQVPDIIELQKDGVFLTGGWVDKLHRTQETLWETHEAILPGTVLVVSWKPRVVKIGGTKRDLTPEGAFPSEAK